MEHRVTSPIVYHNEDYYNGSLLYGGIGCDIKRNEDGNYSIPCGLGYLDKFSLKVKNK